jgi:hypothetical protein
LAAAAGSELSAPATPLRAVTGAGQRIHVWLSVTSAGLGVAIGDPPLADRLRAGHMAPLAEAAVVGVAMVRATQATSAAVPASASVAPAVLAEHASNQPKLVLTHLQLVWAGRSPVSLGDGRLYVCASTVVSFTNESHALLAATRHVQAQKLPRPEPGGVFGMLSHAVDVQRREQGDLQRQARVEQDRLATRRLHTAAGATEMAPVTAAVYAGLNDRLGKSALCGPPSMAEIVSGVSVHFAAACKAQYVDASVSGAYDRFVGVCVQTAADRDGGGAGAGRRAAGGQVAVRGRVALSDEELRAACGVNRHAQHLAGMNQGCWRQLQQVSEVGREAVAAAPVECCHGWAGCSGGDGRHHFVACRQNRGAGAGKLLACTSFLNSLVARPDAFTYVGVNRRINRWRSLCYKLGSEANKERGLPHGQRAKSLNIDVWQQSAAEKAAWSFDAIRLLSMVQGAALVDIAQLAEGRLPPNLNLPLVLYMAPHHALAVHAAMAAATEAAIARGAPRPIQGASAAMPQRRAGGDLLDDLMQPCAVVPGQTRVNSYEPDEDLDAVIDCPQNRASLHSLVGILGEHRVHVDTEQGVRISWFAPEGSPMDEAVVRAIVSAATTVPVPDARGNTPSAEQHHTMHLLNETPCHVVVNGVPMQLSLGVQQLGVLKGMCQCRRCGGQRQEREYVRLLGGAGGGGDGEAGGAGLRGVRNDGLAWERGYVLQCLADAGALGPAARVRRYRRDGRRAEVRARGAARDRADMGGRGLHGPAGPARPVQPGVSAGLRRRPVREGGLRRAAAPRHRGHPADGSASRPEAGRRGHLSKPRHLLR